MGSERGNVTDRPKIFYGWIIVAAGAITLALVYGWQLSYGIFLTELQGDFGWTRARLSGAYSLYMIVHGIMYLVAGSLNDRCGPRLMLTIAITTMGIAYALLSIINTPWQLYVFYGIMIGTGMSFAYLPVMSTVTRWFKKKRGSALGTTGAIQGIGILISAPVIQFLIIEFGWRSSYLILAVLLVVILLPVSRLMRLDPSEKGLSPDGVEETVTRNKLPSSVTGLTLMQAIKTKAFWLLFIMYLLFLSPLHTIMVHLKVYAVGVGIPEMIAATILGLVSGGSIVGMIVIGKVSDKIKKGTCLFIVYILLATTMLYLIEARQVWQFYLFSLTYGFGMGGGLILFPVIIGERFGTKFHGSIFGALSMAHIAAATGPSLAGYIHDTTGSYELAIIIGAVASFIAMGLSLTMRTSAFGNQGSLYY